MISLIDATANGVVKASEAHGGEWLVLNQEEGGDIASGANRFVVNGLDVEGVLSEEVSALAVGNDVIEGDFTVEVRVGSEGVVIGVRDLGDEAVGGGETKDDESLSFTGVSIGITGEEITGGDGVGGVFRAGGQGCLDARESRDVVNGCKVEGVGGIGGIDAISDLVGEVDVAVEVGVRSEGPAGIGGVQLKGTNGSTVVVCGDEIGDVEGE